MPIFDQGGRDKAHRLDIKSIDDQAQAAKNKNAGLERADLVLVEDFGNVYGFCF